MKKLPVILFVVFVLLIVGSIPAPSQEAKEEVEAEVSLELTKVEDLELRLVLKDIVLAAQQLQILQTQFQAAVVARDLKQQEFQTMLAGLRITHSAPEDKFSFNPNTMKFVPVPEKPKVKEE